jgi:SAM-dependent methyltransferase
MKVLTLSAGDRDGMGQLSQRHSQWQVETLDLALTQPDTSQRRGSACDIPLTDGSFDAVVSYIALEHVGDLDRALAEMRRILKPGGLLIVFDRNPISPEGFLKPWRELRGERVYSWDSPFHERWYTPRTWRQSLAANGFVSVSSETVNSRTDRGLSRLIPSNPFIIVAGQRGP